MLVKDGKSRAKGRLQRPAARMGRAIEDAISSRDPVVATVARINEWADTGRIQCDIGAMENVEVTCRSIENIAVGHHILIRKMGKGPTQRWVFAGWLGTGTSSDIVPEARLGCIPAHAPTHQDGGSDEINVGGLSGDLADPQDPKGHGTSHQDGGSDEINVAGLSGELADPQPPKTHASSHQNGGSDEISVAGLSGVLADEQDAGKIKGVDVDNSAIGDGKVMVYRTASGDLEYETQAGGGGTDEKVKVSSDDTTADHLINKLTNAGPITLTEISGGGNEDLQIGYARGNVKWVTKSGGDYSTVASALAAITDASATNRYAIIVGPDVGSEAVTLKSYVDIIGLGVFCGAADSVPTGMRVTGSPTDVAIHNMLIAAKNTTYPVNLSAGNVEFHGCRIVHGYDADNVTYSPVRITGGDHRFYNCYIQDDGSGSLRCADAVVVTAGTVKFFGGEIRCESSYSSVDGIDCSGGTVELYGGVKVYANGGKALNQSSTGTIAVYEASYDPTDVTGTITGESKQTVIGELEVLFTPGCQAESEANDAMGDGGTWRTCNLDTSSWDYDSMLDLTNDRIVIKTAGRYIIGANDGFKSVDDGTRVSLRILLNGTTILGHYDGQAGVNNKWIKGFASGCENLSVNDYLEMQLRQDSGGSLDTIGGLFWATKVA